MKTAAAFATTCRDRLRNLQETLPSNLAALKPGETITVLDYNCSQGTFEWCRRELADHIKAGRLRVYREASAPRFVMPHAKNAAHLLAARTEAKVLVNLDADNLLKPHYLAQLRRTGFARPLVLAPRESNDANGRVAIGTVEFFRLGGYDEEMNWGWGYEDSDLIERARASGIQLLRAVIDELSYKPNSGSREAGQRPGAATMNDSLERHKEISRRSLAAGRLVANAGRKWGAMQVIDHEGRPLVVGYSGR